MDEGSDQGSPYPWDDVAASDLESPTSVIESGRNQNADVERFSLPKSISVRSNGYLKNPTHQPAAPTRTRTATKPPPATTPLNVTVNTNLTVFILLLILLRNCHAFSFFFLFSFCVFHGVSVVVLSKLKKSEKIKKIKLGFMGLDV